MVFLFRGYLRGLAWRWGIHLDVMGWEIEGNGMGCSKPLVGELKACIHNQAMSGSQD